ncbi:endonuclease/exonuclease/phosphatase family protein [Pontibacter sp. G13]|uniref:endonuclease/exonuclease/phosphatase family protein n=1 Tax=Pontibacter sp. G13 TaxID=3074898 RepID=UPI00288BF68B|nr:endonuclease/exonuclease/phosphatase family protein [Pontibacter sp. G13]WNJ19595.1 endonuclease/exonuclease/phosphatase family protein [Pontibacter sp. G13]
MKKRINGFWAFLVQLCYIPILVATVMGIIAPWVPASVSPIFQLMTPVVGWMWPLHLLFLPFCWRMSWKWTLYSSLSVLGCLWVFMQDVEVAKPVDAISDQPLKVLSFNVGTFDYEADNISKVADLIHETQPDVVCLQEFRNIEMPNGEHALEHLGRTLGFPYMRFEHLRAHIHGAVIYSKMPILRMDTLYMPPREINSGVMATIQAPFGKVGIGNLHMSSYRVAQTLAEHESFRPKVAAMYHQAKAVIYLQQAKVDETLSKTDQYPYPMILTGDMNSVPHSLTVRRLSDNFADSFDTAGNGLGWTFPLWKGLGLRIDYQFYSEELLAIQHEVIPDDVSDHYPVLVTYILSP